MSLGTLLGHFSYGLLAASFATKDIFWLRAVCIAGCLANVAYNFAWSETPRWLPITWNILFVVLHVGHIVLLLRERSGIRFTELERDLYAGVFRDLAPFEFAKLMRIAAVRVAPAGERLIEQHHLVPCLSLIYSGELRVHQGEKTIARLRAGDFVGEMSYATGERASAHVDVVQETILVEWPRADLKSMMRRSPTLKVHVQSVLSADMAKKLASGPRRQVTCMVAPGENPKRS